LAALADRVPRMVSAVDSDDLATGPELRRVPSNLHAMLEVLDDAHQVLSGMPGAGLARARRGPPFTGLVVLVQTVVPRHGVRPSLTSVSDGRLS
jgi:hypothetical protein